MRSKKIMSIIMSAILLCGALTGCSSKKENNVATKSDDGTVTISFMTWESQEMNEKILAAFDDFMDENPNIKVELVPSPLEDYGTKLNQMITAGEAPDLFMLGDSDERSKAVNGVLYDYTSLIKADGDFIDGFYNGLAEYWNVDGKYYGLPGLVNLTGVLYNKTMFEEAGIEANPDWTYEEMYQIAEKLMDSSNNMYGMYSMPVTPFEFGLYSETAGEEGFTSKLVNIDEVKASDSFKDGVELYKKYLESGAVMTPDYDTSNIVSLFKEGKIPMMWYGQWVADELIRNDSDSLDWGYLPNPAVDQSNYKTSSGCVGWSSPASIENPEETYKVLKYMVTEVYSKILPDTPVAPAAYKDASQTYFDKLVETGHEDMKLALEKMLNAEKVASNFGGAKWSGKAEKIWSESWNSILKGEKDMSTIDTIMSDMNDLIK